MITIKFRRKIINRNNYSHNNMNNEAEIHLLLMIQKNLMHLVDNNYLIKKGKYQQKIHKKFIMIPIKYLIKIEKILKMLLDSTNCPYLFFKIFKMTLTKILVVHTNVVPSKVISGMNPKKKNK